LSPSPCSLRTKRLQENGIIRGYRADIALERLGEVVTVLSEVKISTHHPQDFRRFEQGVARYEEIVECFNVSGGYDYLLKIIVPSVVHFQKLTERMLDDDIGIEKLSKETLINDCCLTVCSAKSS
jgi:DNA-binding Lrp family transcriptional regulator